MLYLHLVLVLLHLNLYLEQRRLNKKSNIKIVSNGTEPRHKADLSTSWANLVSLQSIGL